MPEYFEGTRTIFNEDGSTTYITYDHQPAVEPMTKKEAAWTLGGTFIALAFAIGFPIAADKIATRNQNRKNFRDRQKINKDLFRSWKKSY